MIKIHLLIHPSLIPIIDCFPEFREVAHYLFRENESFHEICLDYEQCRKTLFHWQKKNTGEAKLRTAEYEEILRGLEQELKQYLTDYER